MIKPQLNATLWGTAFSIYYLANNIKPKFAEDYIKFLNSEGGFPKNLLQCARVNGANLTPTTLPPPASRRGAVWRRTEAAGIRSRGLQGVGLRAPEGPDWPRHGAVFIILAAVNNVGGVTWYCYCEVHSLHSHPPAQWAQNLLNTSIYKFYLIPTLSGMKCSFIEARAELWIRPRLMLPKSRMHADVKCSWIKIVHFMYPSINKLINLLQLISDTEWV